MMNQIPFMKYKWFFIALSLVILTPGLVSLAVNGLRLSIDFTGGSLLELKSATPSAAFNPALFSSVAKSQGLDLASVQPAGPESYILRFKPLTQVQAQSFQSQISSVAGQVVEQRFETVGPTVGRELTQKALLAVFIASGCIIAYIAWSFRRIPSPYSSWKFGICAVLALIHDSLVVLGLFSIFGYLYHVEVDALFVTALLTVIGFSVHDTIVVFDRVRENLPKLPRASFEEVIDFALTETLARSLNTSLTVTLTLTSLLLFGGETIRWFVVALLIGIFSGTFSSIYTAAPILVLWEKGKK